MEVVQLELIVIPPSILEYYKQKSNKPCSSCVFDLTLFNANRILSRTCKKSSCPNIKLLVTDFVTYDKHTDFIKNTYEQLSRELVRKQNDVIFGYSQLDIDAIEDQQALFKDAYGELKESRIMTVDYKNQQIAKEKQTMFQYINTLQTTKTNVTTELSMVLEKIHALTYVPIYGNDVVLIPDFPLEIPI